MHRKGRFVAHTVSVRQLMRPARRHGDLPGRADSAVETKAALQI
jgi:hypothetical protein